MAMVVKNNMGAVRTLNTLNKNSSALQKSLAKVSSGMKINSAQDDASGYAISERMRVQIRSLDQANQNTQNASSLMKTAEGAVSSTMEILKSLKEKAVNAATDTNTDQDRATIQKELNQFIDQIDDNALTTFNGKFLVDGSKSQIGSDTATTMTNQSLGLYDTTGAELTGETKLTNLTNRNEESLEIKETDSITASFVMNGKTYTTTYKVADTTLENVFENLNEVYASDAAVAGTTAAFGSGAAGEAVAPDPNKDPAVVAAKQALDDAKTAETNALNDLTAKKDAVNGKVTSFLNNIANLSSVKSNSVGGDSWNNPTAFATEFGDAKKAVSDWAETFEVDGSTKGTKSESGFTVTGFAGSTYYMSITNSTVQQVLQSTQTWSWKLVNNATTIEAGKSGYNTALSDYNDAIDTYDAAKTTTTNAQTAYQTALANAKSSVGGTSSASSDPLVKRDSFVGVNAFGDKVYTNDGDTGLTVTAATAGIKTQISGLTLSITDSEGNVKKSANAALDAFKTTIYAKNKSDANELTFQVGASANQAITVGLDDMRAEALGLKGTDGSKVSVATQDKANAAIAVFDNAIQKVLDHQATIGAVEARLEYTSQNLTTSSENVQAAESTIRDADMAKEMTEYTKNNVLLQAAQSMLAQANQNSSAVLSLLQ